MRLCLISLLSQWLQPYWSANDNWSYTGGQLFTNGDREIDYLGMTVSFTKRLANQWMMRGYVQYNFDESWSVPTSYFSKNDPNRVLPAVDAGAVIDGSKYVVQSTGSGNVLSSTIRGFDAYQTGHG